MNIIIVRGVSGSGKSRFIEDLKGKVPSPRSARFELEARNGWPVRECRDFYSVSADTYFTDANGNYNFDPKYLGAAHAQCMKRYIDFIRNPDMRPADVLFVDNTNTSLVEVAPYITTAQAHGHNVSVATLLIDPIIAYERNTHAVPLTNVVRQHASLMKSIEEWPAFWPKDCILRAYHRFAE